MRNMGKRDKDEESMPAIMCEAGWDEAFLVGTENELRSLAQGIIAALEAPSKSSDFLGVQCRTTTGPRSEVWGDARINGLVVTEDTTQKRSLINALRKRNGEDPVAAEGWPS